MQSDSVSNPLQILQIQGSPDYGYRVRLSDEQWYVYFPPTSFYASGEMYTSSATHKFGKFVPCDDPRFIFISNAIRLLQ